MRTIGQFLRDARLAAAITQRQAAEAAGVGYPHISKIEADRERPSDALLAALARVYDVDPDDVMIHAARIPADVQVAMLRKGKRAFRLMRAWTMGRVTDAAVQGIIRDS